MDIVLETERLTLRRFTEADVDLLVELDSDPAVMRFLSGGISTPCDLIEHVILPNFLRSYAPLEGFGVWAAQERVSGDFIGWLSLRPTRAGDPTKASLGYRLRRAAWGHGYATEGARALLRRGFTELGAQRVVASTYSGNAASRRVMERLGMTLVRTFRYTEADGGEDNITHVDSGEVWEGDEVEYAITLAEWERAHGTMNCE